MSNHYETLGVPASADAAEIKAAYRRLIRVHHPDIAGPAGVTTSGLVNAAYSALGDPGRREVYDRGLAEPVGIEVEDVVKESWGQTTDSWLDAAIVDEPAGVEVAETRLPPKFWLIASIASLAVGIAGAVVFFGADSSEWKTLMSPLITWTLLVAVNVPSWSRGIGLSLLRHGGGDTDNSSWRGRLLVLGLGAALWSFGWAWTVIPVAIAILGWGSAPGVLAASALLAVTVAAPVFRAAARQAWLRFRGLR